MRWFGAAVFVVVAMAPRLAFAQDGTPFFDDPPPSTSRLPPTTPAPVSTVPEPDPATDLPEDPGQPFGRRGSFVVTSTAGAGIDGSFYTHSEATRVGFTIAPELDYFFARNVSIGVTTTFSYGVGRGYGADYSLVETRSSGVYVGPKLGVNLRIGDRFSFYPNVSFGIEWRHREQELVRGGSTSVPSPLPSLQTTQTGFWIEIAAPLLFHVRSNAFIGIGPSFFHEFARATGGPDVGGERTGIGGAVLFGGHWGGAVERTVTRPVQAARRFGDGHHLVVGGDLSASYFSYGGSDSTNANVSIYPGVDYFVGYRVSLGVGGSFSYSYARGVDASNGASVASRYVFGGGSVRVGYDVRATEWLSIYPRAALTLGVESFDLREGSSGNRYSDLLVRAHLAVPLLFHVAPHVSIGFGPYVAQDVYRQFTPTRTLIPMMTTVGGSLYLATWL